MSYITIEDKVFGSESEHFKKGIEASIQNLQDLGYKYNTHIVRGTHDFVIAHQKTLTQNGKKVLPYIPDLFNCNYYYGVLKPLNKSLLNGDAVYITWGAFKKNVRDFFTHLSSPERIFLRPNSGQKIFTGTTIGNKYPEKECDIIQNDNPLLNDSTHILVSSYKKVDNEYRFLAINGKMITYSAYSNPKGGRSMPRYAHRELVKKVARLFCNGVFTIDICDTDGKIRIVEINSFNCAGLYDMASDGVVHRSIANYASTL